MDVRKIKYPVGIQTFSEIITEKYFYVDKTALVYQLVNDSKYIFLSRPRRFGKSLLMSTLEAYFKGMRELFTGLDIMKLENEWCVYPVFRFDLSGENYTSVERMVEHIKAYLDMIEEDYGLKAEGSISTRMQLLLRQAYRKYGKRVVVLVDEYDKPILDCMHSASLNESLKNELRAFYSAIKASDEYIRFTMLTGITKFGKVSIFSGLNNLLDISLLPAYNAICGITQREFQEKFKEPVKIFAHSLNIPPDDAWNRFKTLYDGYHFSHTGDFIYNPFSVLSALKIEQFKNYWYETASPTFLIKLIESHSYSLDKLEGARRRESQLGNITDIDNDFVPLLYQSGYLTIKDYDFSSDEYVLGFPNLEVRKAFWESMVDHFFRNRNGGSEFDINRFLHDINSGNPEGFMSRLQSLFADTSSEYEINKEIHFQNMMATVAKMLGLTVRTEVHSSAGRCDMQILTPQYIYIFEFKIDSSATHALSQIKKRGYAEPFGADSRSKFIIGANFSSASRTFTDWIIENI
ncbi:MAG: ATP-binding protein [Muribaculaceae bacterium]|nr:ATP-binding protein [Muribaculaceae bacterium]